MAVPEEIRMVERPVNTIVEDRGKDGPFRYAVRERNGVRYVKGGNPMPRSFQLRRRLLTKAQTAFHTDQADS